MDTIKNTSDVKVVIDALTAKFNIEQIYLNTYDQDTSPFELVILVSNKYVKTLGDLVPKVMNTIRDHPQYNVLCYVAFQARDKIREGNLFLFASCQPHKLIYKKEHSDFVSIPEKMDRAKCSELAMGLRRREQRKIDGFKEGYYHFKGKGEYGLASFMLHQAVELTYRYLELLLIAKERITHSIRSHHLYLKKISSVYKGIFDEEDQDDVSLLSVLEGIYRSTRYEDGFEIDHGTLRQLETKMEALHANAAQIFGHIISSFGQRQTDPIRQKDSLPHPLEPSPESFVPPSITVSDPNSIVMKLSAQQIVNKLISLMEISMIYLSEIDQGLYPKPVFIIILGKDSTALSPELRTMVDNIFRKGTDSLYLVFPLEYACQQLREENLFFVHGLRKENLVYRSLGISSDPFPGKTVNEALFNRVKDRLKQELAKTGHFWESAIGLLEQEDFRQAALMFHQHMEHLFRTIELFVMGKEMESHSIQEHQGHVGGFVPELGCVFHAEVENEQKVLDLLDGAYIAVRNGNDHHINREQIDVIKSKAEWTAYTVRKIINRQYHVFELKYLAPSVIVHKESGPRNNTGQAVTATGKDPLLEQVIELLISKVDLHSVYLIGRKDKISSWETYVTPMGKGHEQSTAYTLLMVTHSPLPIPLSKLADDIYNRLPCRVYIIGHTLGDVCHKIDRGSNFLDRFLTEAPLLFAKDESLVSLNHTPHYHGKDWKRIRKVWKARFKRATYLLSILEDVYQEIDGEPTVKMGIMRYALEQVCLGLLYVFWEFRPAHNTLPYLFHLCSHFTDLPDEIFSGTSHTRGHIYYLLSTAHHQMRFKSKSGITKKEAEKAFGLSNDFMAGAKKVADVELQRLKRLHCIEEVV